MVEIVINQCFGGFGLSPLAVVEYYKKKGIDVYTFIGSSSFSTTNVKPIELYDITKDNVEHIHMSFDPIKCDDDNYVTYYDIERTDPILVEVVKELGEKANGSYAQLEIVCVPDDVDWYIDDYDGIESVHETHRCWG